MISGLAPREPVTTIFLFGHMPRVITSSVCPLAYDDNPAPIYLWFRLFEFITIPRAAAQYTIYPLFFPQYIFCLESYTLNPLTKLKVNFFVGADGSLFGSMFINRIYCWWEQQEHLSKVSQP